jgi:hypothetical protein
MQWRALDVLGKRVLLGRDLDAGIAHNAGHRRGLGETLLFDEMLKLSIGVRSGPRIGIQKGPPLPTF